MPLAAGRFRWLAHLQRDQYRSRAEVLANQEERLAALLSHAAARVPFYRRRLAEAGVTGSNGRVDLSRFEALQPLEREDLRGSFAALRDEGLAGRRWWVNSTSGSTGSPVKFIQDVAYRDAVHATKLLFDQWAGYLPGMRKALLWGSLAAIQGRKSPLRERVLFWVRNERWIDVVAMSAEPDRALAILEAFRPALLQGYSEAVWELALFADAAGIQVSPIPAVITSAGTLTARMRNSISGAFSARVLNRYGTREVGDLACDCGENRGLHVSAPTHFVEIVRPDSAPTASGEVGDLLVTCLVNRAMPLIRYRIGDEGAWSPSRCPCGRSWPLLAEVSGRVSDVFLTVTGRRVRAGMFNQLFCGQDWVARFQIVQEARDAMRIRIEPSRRYSGPQVDRVTFARWLPAGVERLLGDRCSTIVEYVDGIEAAPNGKFRYVVSEVPRGREALASGRG